jgi:hypothetical protein
MGRREFIAGLSGTALLGEKPAFFSSCGANGIMTFSTGVPMLLREDSITS